MPATGISCMLQLQEAWSFPSCADNLRPNAGISEMLRVSKINPLTDQLQKAVTELGYLSVISHTANPRGLVIDPDKWEIICGKIMERSGDGTFGVIPFGRPSNPCHLGIQPDSLLQPVATLQVENSDLTGNSCLYSKIICGSTWVCSSK